MDDSGFLNNKNKFMEISYAFPLSEQQPKPFSQLRAGETVTCGICSIANVESSCSTKTLPYNESMKIHMEAMSWGTKCECPRVTEKDASNDCKFMVRMDVNPSRFSGNKIYEAPALSPQSK